MSRNELSPQTSLIDLPKELFALISTCFDLYEVCQLRATCRTIAGYSRVLAGACSPACCILVQDGVCAPEAVLAWAVGGDLFMPRRKVRTYFPLLCSGVNWFVSAASAQGWRYLAHLPPHIRRRLALHAESVYGIELSATALCAIADARALTIDYSNIPPDILPSIFGGLAAAISNARPYAVRNVCVDGAPFLFNATALADVAHVHLTGCHKLTDVSALAGSVRVSLSGCSRLTDVSALRGVRFLRLLDCPHLTDVSMLGGVRYVSLLVCRLLTDVSMLSGVRHLDLSNCYNVTDVSALGGVDTLILERCHGVVDVSALGTVRHLDLTRCDNITDVSALGSVATLILVGCLGVVDVSALGTVRHLDLSNCPRLVHVSALGGVRSLDLSYCRCVVDASALGNVSHLNLRGSGVTDYTALTRVPRLLK